MAHIKVKWRPDLRAPGLTMGVELKRLTEAEILATAGRSRRTFGPPPSDCVASCNALVVTTDPSPFVYGTPYDILVWPNQASVLCEGDCLEWSMELVYALGSPPTPPNVTAEAGEDCVGLILHVNATVEEVFGWSAVVAATLAGEPFCDPLTVTLSCQPAWESWSFPDGSTYPEEPGAYSGVTRTIRATGQDLGLCNPVLDWSFGAEWSGAHEHVLQYEVAAGTVIDDDTVDYQVFLYDDLGGSLAGTTLTLHATYNDPDLGPSPFGDGVVFSCEV